MKPVVRILIVADDEFSDGGFLQWTGQTPQEAVGSHSREFHLGEFVRVLEDTVWIGFIIELTKAHRTEPSGFETEAQILARSGADVAGFRFGQSFAAHGEKRNLADYDMILFFPTSKTEPDSQFAAEAEAIAQFMEDGGGFFATGDHENFGATLAGLIPRVRSMRRWWKNTGPNGEPAAPSATKKDRHDTTQPGVDGVVVFEDQSDEVAQPITPTLYNSGYVIKNGKIYVRQYPHPLLCSPDGIVRYLPDHMHEGWCEVPDGLAARSFKLGASDVREYPDYMPDNPPPNYVPEPLAPEVVATAHVAPGLNTPVLDPVHTGGDEPTVETTFGVIGAWDGHRVKKGRVVVDATWHHFFNINLTGDRFLEDEGLGGTDLQKLHGFFVDDGMGNLAPDAQYQMIMWYFRNIVYWLIPAKRHEPIWWHLITDLANRPQFQEEMISTLDDLRGLTFDHFYYFGQLAEDYFAKARGACALYPRTAWHEPIYKPKIPWWEWIQRYVDVWDPAQKFQPRGDLAQNRFLGAQGVGANVQLPARITLGAALVTAGFVRLEMRRSRNRDMRGLLEAVHRIWPGVLEHAVGTFGERIRRGAELNAELEGIAHLREPGRTAKAPL